MLQQLTIAKGELAAPLGTSDPASEGRRSEPRPVRRSDGQEEGTVGSHAWQGNFEGEVLLGLNSEGRHGLPESEKIAGTLRAGHAE